MCESITGSITGSAPGRKKHEWRKVSCMTGGEGKKNSLVLSSEEGHRLQRRVSEGEEQLKQQDKERLRMEEETQWKEDMECVHTEIALVSRKLAGVLASIEQVEARLGLVPEITNALVELQAAADCNREKNGKSNSDARWPSNSQVRARATSNSSDKASEKAPATQSLFSFGWFSGPSRVSSADSAKSREPQDVRSREPTSDVDDLPPSPPPLPVRPPSDSNEDDAPIGGAHEDGGWSRGSSPLPPSTSSPQVADNDPDADLENAPSLPVPTGDGNGGGGSKHVQLVT